MAPIPVILDTDIGTDIDDTWALAMLLRCPELDLKLVTTCTGDTVYRTRLAARFLEEAGFSEVEVGTGKFTQLLPGHITQGPWVENYKLEDYPGVVHKDGIRALINTVMNSTEMVTIICIGPLTNIAEALEREPNIAKKARFVSMHGSINWSHETGFAVAEYNIKMDITACQKVFNAPWEKTVTPLDTCGKVKLSGLNYKRVAESQDPIAKLVIENYEVWKKAGGWVFDSDQSSILFDCVAIHLAYSTKWLKMEKTGLRITDDGFMLIDDLAPSVNYAIDWTNREAFEEFVATRLTTKQIGRLE